MTVQQFGEVRPPADARPDLALDSGVRVGGVDVRYSVSGEGSRDLVLVHGHGAHHLWWQGIAPLLEPHWRRTPSGRPASCSSTPVSSRRTGTGRGPRRTSG
jgi:hypothetical protein